MKWVIKGDTRRLDFSSNVQSRHGQPEIPCQIVKGSGMEP